MVNTEYLEIKAQLHNQWLAESDLLWRTSRKRLAYPLFPPFPTEDIIVARAKVLLEFLSKDNSPVVPFPMITTVPAQGNPTDIEVTNVTVVEVEPTPMYTEASTLEVNEETQNETAELEKPEEVNDTAAPKRLPSILRRLMGS